MEKNREKLMNESKVVEMWNKPFEKIVEEVLNLGKNGENVKVFIQGCNKWIYSFQTENEIYQTVFGMKKTELEKKIEEDQRQYQEDCAREEKECRAIAEERFPEWKNVISRNFSKETAKSILDYYSSKSNKPSGYKKWHIETIENAVKMLNAADENQPVEILEKMYLESNDLADNRFNYYYRSIDLTESKHADIFGPMVLRDIDKLFGKEHENYEKVANEILKRAKKAEEDKAAIEEIKKGPKK